MALIGVVVGLGCLQVAQRNAIFLKGYAVGERMHRVHTRENEVAWLSTRVTGLASPMRLADIAKERRLTLVAWSRLSPAVAQPHGMSPDDPSTRKELSRATSGGETAD